MGEVNIFLAELNLVQTTTKWYVSFVKFIFSVSVLVDYVLVLTLF